MTAARKKEALYLNVSKSDNGKNAAAAGKTVAAAQIKIDQLHSEDKRLRILHYTVFWFMFENLISFGEKDLVDIAAEDAVDLEDECDHDCENCPVALCSPYYKGRIKQTESVAKGAPLLHLPAQIVRKYVPSQPEVDEDESSRRSHILRLLRRLVAQYYDVCDSFDELRDTVEELLDDHFQQSMTD